MNPWLGYLCRWPLLPWVILRGRRLRRDIPSLPEAPGPRVGGDASAPLHLLTLGESPIAGVGLDHQRDNLAPEVARRLSLRLNDSVAWTILGQKGIRLAELLPLFEDHLPPRTDFIFISMGVNDCKEATAVRAWRRQWRAVLHALKERYPRARVLCCTLPPFASFPSLPWSVRQFLSARATLMDHALSEELRGWPDVALLRLPPQLEPEAFAADGFHPNALAHRRWASVVERALVESPGTKSGQVVDLDAP